MAEKERKATVEVRSSHYISERKQELNRRLRKWGNWFIGSAVVGFAGLGLMFVSGPIGWVGLGIAAGASVVNTVATFGMLGNVIKGMRK